MGERLVYRLSVVQVVLVTALAAWLGAHAVLLVDSGRDVETAFGEAARQGNLEASKDLVWREWAEKATLGLYDGATRRKDALEAARAETVAAELRLRRGAMVFAGTAMLGLAGALLLARGRVRADVVPAALSVIALACLAVGILTPSIAFVNERDVPVLGQVVTEAQIKSIWGSIVALHKSGNSALAAVLVGACLVVPVAKAALLGAVLWRRRIGIDRDHDGVVSGKEVKIEQRLVGLARLVGKFSFLDLLVGAIMLSLFALESVEGSVARSQPGLMFFAAYCGLSFVAGLLVWVRRVEQGAGSASQRAGDAGS